MIIKTVDYDLHPEDAVALILYAADHHADGRKTLWSRPLGWVVLSSFGIPGAAAVLLDILVLNRPPTRFAWTSALLVPAVIALFPVLRLVRPVTLRQKFQKPEKARHFGPQRLTISPETFTISTSLATDTCSWTLLRQIAVTKDHAFLILDTDSGYALPRRAFRDEEAFLDFVSTVQDFHGMAIHGDFSFEEGLVGWRPAGR